MTALTPERLAAIRENVAHAVSMLQVDPWEAHVDVLDARDLLAHADHLTKGILDLHVRHVSIQCGVTADAPHRHYRDRHDEVQIRPLVCTQPEGHEGPHRDAICCWRFETFTEDPPVVITGRRPLERRDHSSCAHCHTSWPCATVSLLNPDRRRDKP